MTTRATSRILFLLDSDAAAAASDVLRSRGCDTHQTADGDEAARLLATDCWHALVLDLDLPGFDVLGLVAALRSHPETRHVTILARADSLRDDLAELALSCGCDRLIAGRLSGGQLANEIDRFVAQRPSRMPSAA